MSIPFKIGYCVNCGVQTWVTNPSNAPLRPMDNTYLVWICLCNDSMAIKTRIGSISLCAACFGLDPDPNDLLENLALNPMSGWTGDETEATRYPNRKIEVIKRFGD